MHCKNAQTEMLFTFIFNEESSCILETKPSQEQRGQQKTPLRQLDLRTSFAADPHWIPTHSISSTPRDQSDERGRAIESLS
mmetsp:Transcript_29932/g.41716  ORF Transcript_29932/g.41716 Transcript_29932/m.41716 type:complete len:81 (+) Transcript_29932:102-344(+)